jgi:hypothetical protein
VAQNNFDTGLQRMTRRAAEAAQGTGVAKDAFKELGVVLKDNQGHVRRSEDLLADVAAGMEKIEDPSRRVALAFKLFDTEGVSMVNMLRNGKDALLAMRIEARQLGFVIGEEDARNAEAFNDNLTRTRLIITGMRNEVGARLLPVFSELMVQFRSWMAVNRQMVKSGVEKALHALIVLLKALYRAGRIVANVLSDIVELFGGIENAARAAAWALGIFAGIQALTALGTMTMALAGIVKALRAVKIAALAANAAAMIMPVLIGAAVAAVILIIQDLYTYFTGGDSVTGRILEVFEKKFPRAFSIAASAMKQFMALINGLNAFLAATIDYITGLLTFDWNRMVRATENMLHAFDPLIERWKQTIGDAVDWIMDKLQPLVHALDTVRGWTSTAKEVIGDKATGAWNAAKEAVGLGAAGWAQPPLYGVSRFNDVRVNAPITVTVPEGTPAEAVGRAVQKGVSDGIARMLRQTATATEPRVEY